MSISYSKRSVLIDNSFLPLLPFFFLAIMINPSFYYLFLFFYIFFSARRNTLERKKISRKIGRQKSETKPILKPRAFLSLRITTANRYTTHEDVKGTRASISDESSYSSLLDYQNNFSPLDFFRFERRALNYDEMNLLHLFARHPRSLNF